MMKSFLLQLHFILEKKTTRYSHKKCKKTQPINLIPWPIILFILLRMIRYNITSYSISQFLIVYFRVIMKKSIKYQLMMIPVVMNNQRKFYRKKKSCHWHQTISRISIQPVYRQRKWFCAFQCINVVFFSFFLFRTKLFNGTI